MLFEITTEAIAPITSGITGALTTLIPIGIGIMATFIGLSLIKRVIYTFLQTLIIHKFFITSRKAEFITLNR